MLPSICRILGKQRRGLGFRRGEFQQPVAEEGRIRGEMSQLCQPSDAWLRESRSSMRATVGRFLVTSSWR